MKSVFLISLGNLSGAYNFFLYKLGMGKIPFNSRPENGFLRDENSLCLSSVISEVDLM